MNSLPDFTLAHQHRLKHKQLIDLLFEQGKGVTSFPLRVQYMVVEDASTHYQVGFVVPKRQWKRAVDRNRIKRLLREAFRRQHHTLTEAYLSGVPSILLFVIYIGKEMPTQAIADKAVIAALDKVRKQL